MLAPRVVAVKHSLTGPLELCPHWLWFSLTFEYCKDEKRVAPLSLASHVSAHGGHSEPYTHWLAGIVLALAEAWVDV